MNSLGDPNIPEKSNRVPGFFDPLPRWFTQSLLKSGEFAKFPALGFKLLGYFSCVRQKNPFITGWTTYEELAKTVGACPRRTTKAVMTLAAIGAIRIETRRKEKRFKLIFQSPFTHPQQNGNSDGRLPHAYGTSSLDRRANQRPQQIDVSLDASVEGHSSSEMPDDSSDKSARFVRQPCSKSQASLDPDGDPYPAWVLETDPPAVTGYPQE